MFPKEKVSYEGLRLREVSPSRQLKGVTAVPHAMPCSLFGTRGWNNVTAKYCHVCITYKKGSGLDDWIIDHYRS
jgi:hypothetical protein